MAKNTKALKPLPSASTVASTVKATPRTPPVAPPAKSKPAEPKIAKEPASTPKPRPTPAKVAAKPAPPQPAALSSEDRAEKAKAETPALPAAAKTTFTLLEPDATRVTLSGAFNAWSPDATPMSRQPDGLWTASLALPPGRYEYKFVVDGQWLPDPNAQENVPNPHGTLNSVVEVRA